jgi:dienelactone hydrolase
MGLLTALFTTLLLAPEVTGQAVQYKHGDKVLEGYLAYDKKVSGKRPVVLVVHEWRGLNDYARKRAEQLAQLGYLAFAIDMYGKGVLAKDHEEAAKLAGAFIGDRKLMRERAKAGLEVARKHELADPKRIAAMGYCFGGAAALELGRGGAPVIGIATFHANLSSPKPEDGKNIKGKVIVFHGADDGFVPTEQISAFQDEMRKGGVDWQMVSFGGAVHSFTVPEAGNDPKKGMAYNEKADRRSWSMLREFLAEVFK